MRPSTSEAPAALLPPPPLRLLPGGAIQFPGESLFSLWTSAFSRRTVIAMLRQPPNGTPLATQLSTDPPSSDFSTPDGSEQSLRLGF